MKIVLDSNIFVSSFYWAGNPRKVFDRVTNGLDELYITDKILEEIISVMSKKKFDTSINEIKEYVKIIESYSIKLSSKSNPEKKRIFGYYIKECKRRIRAVCARKLSE